MTKHLNSVKKQSAQERGYHHGALRPALIAAAEALIAERGLDRFSLRETARRAGVSPAAPAHHFGDTRGLLTAIATAGFVDLGDALAVAEQAGANRADRVREQGLAYVGFALRQRARFDVMWRAALLDTDDPDYQAAAHRAFALLDCAVRGAAGGTKPTDDPAVAPSLAAWSIVHGFTRLAIDGVFGSAPDAPERAAAALLPAVLDHLSV